MVRVVAARALELMRFVLHFEVVQPGNVEEWGELDSVNTNCTGSRSRSSAIGSAVRDEVEVVLAQVARRREAPVAALDAIRLRLLRLLRLLWLRAGLAKPDDLTADLDAAIALERDLAAAVGGRQDVAALLAR